MHDRCLSIRLLFFIFILLGIPSVAPLSEYSDTIRDRAPDPISINNNYVDGSVGNPMSDNYRSLFYYLKGKIDTDGDGVSDLISVPDISAEKIPAVPSLREEATVSDIFDVNDIDDRAPAEGYIFTFADPLPASILEQLKVNGLRPEKIWNATIYGFKLNTDYNGMLRAVSILNAAGLGGSFVAERNAVRKIMMFTAARQMNVRPRIWTDYGLRGDYNSSIAIIDTGLDGSHTDLYGYSAGGFGSAKIVGWYDAINGLTSPYDDHGHGSHCGGIAGGKGFGTVDANGRFMISSPLELNLTGRTYSTGTYTVSAAVFNVSAPGELKVVADFIDKTAAPDGHVYGRIAIYKDGVQLNISASNTLSAWNDTEVTYNVDSASIGIYEVRAIFDFVNDTGTTLTSPDFYYAIDVFTPITPPSDGFEYSTGIANNVSLVGIKALSASGSGSSSTIIDAINWAVTNRQTYHITVLSMSLGGRSYLMSEHLAVENAVANGLVVVAAAGNDGPGGYTIDQPGNSDSVISVAALDYMDRVTSYSSQGGESYTGFTVKPDIAAPGGSTDLMVLSADTGYNDGYFADQYANDSAAMQGTSMATPAVAGAAALVIEALGGQTVWNYTRNDVMFVKNVLLLTASETVLQRASYPDYSPTLDRGGKDPHEGYGRINVDAAIDAVKSTVSVGNTYTDTLYASSVTPFGRHVWARSVYLEKDKVYNFTLDVPTGADFDLYIYSENPGEYGDPVIIYACTLPGDADGSVVFRAPYSGRYFITVKAITGSGTFRLDLGDNAAPNVISVTVYPSSGTDTLRSVNVTVNALSSVSVDLIVGRYDGYNPVTSTYGENIASVRLYDDGNHNDGSAGDGIFGGVLNVTGYPDGRYTVRPRVNVTSSGKMYLYPSIYGGFYIGDDTDPPEGDAVVINPSVRPGENVRFHGMFRDISGISFVNISIYTLDGTFVRNVTMIGSTTYPNDPYLEGYYMNGSTVFTATGMYYYDITAGDGAVSSNILYKHRAGYFNVTDMPLNGPADYETIINATYSWITAANQLTPTSVDDGYAQLTLPFTLTLYGETFNTIYISTNGYISLYNNTPDEYLNPQFPSRSTDPDARMVIAPFWADLYMGATGSGIYYTSTADYTVIEWRSAYVIISGTAYLLGSFEVIIYSNSTLKFQYAALSSYANQILPTCGINRGLGSDLSSSYRQIDQLIGNNIAVIFIPPPPKDVPPSYFIDYPVNNSIIYGNTIGVRGGPGIAHLDSITYRILYSNGTVLFGPTTTEPFVTAPPGSYIIEVNGTLNGFSVIKSYSITLVGNLSTVITSLAINADLKICLNWSEAPDADYYKIYRNSTAVYPSDLVGVQPYAVVYGASNTSFVEENTTEGRYYYTVIPVNTLASGFPVTAVIDYNYTGTDTDGDNITDYDEKYVYGTNPLKNDTDDDNLSDYYEINNGLDPLNPDTDGDGLKDGTEILVGTDPKLNDTDSDGLSDGLEVLNYSTDPLKNDTDSDGLSDGVEVGVYGTDPSKNDTDSDGLSDGLEIFVYSTDPCKSDTDSDMLNDNSEISIYGTDPLKNDTDSDGLSDGLEVLNYSTDPLKNDTDLDLLVDGLEVLKYGTNPLDNDTDDDTLSDGAEVNIYGTDPLKKDTDGDSFDDGTEIREGSDPLDPNSTPLTGAGGGSVGGFNTASAIAAVVIVVILAVIIVILIRKRSK